MKRPLRLPASPYRRNHRVSNWFGRLVIVVVLCSMFDRGENQYHDASQTELSHNETAASEVPDAQSASFKIGGKNRIKDLIDH
jgi:hypothetical protein